MTYFWDRPNITPLYRQERYYAQPCFRIWGTCCLLPEPEQTLYWIKMLPEALFELHVLNISEKRSLYWTGLLNPEQWLEFQKLEAERVSLRVLVHECQNRHLKCQARLSLSSL